MLPTYAERGACGAMKKFAVVFPGQGSQRVGMLADTAAEHTSVRQTFYEASAVLGLDLWDLAEKGPAEKLQLTENTQPLMLVAGVALWRIWREQNRPRPAFMAGHSLGEITALVCAGVLDFAPAVDLVRARGQFMQEAVPAGEGAMAAVLGLPDPEVIAACQGVQGEKIVQAVNFNAPGQVVIAGHAAAVEQAATACREAGARRVTPLPVSAPFHTELMRPAGQRLEKMLSGITLRSPEVPVVHNVHAKTEPEPEKIRALLAEQVYSPVRWSDSMRQMAAGGVTQIVECGPGKVLCTMGRRIVKDLECLAMDPLSALEETLSCTSGSP